MEEKIITQRQTKKQKIKKICEQKVLSRSFDLCGGLSFLMKIGALFTHVKKINASVCLMKTRAHPFTHVKPGRDP